MERAKKLKLERNKTEMLLRANLPAHIVRELKDRREIIAEQFEQVTVLFLDLVGFTDEKLGGRGRLDYLSRGCGHGDWRLWAAGFLARHRGRRRGDQFGELPEVLDAGGHVPA
jgi:hypothetical protein